jgi:SAM-dependent methyltransferase
MVRNFYGVLRVSDLVDPRLVVPQDNPARLFEPPDPRYRELLNGTINHGLQLLAPGRRREATTYYSPKSGIGVALREAAAKGALRVGVIGLGAGTIATYGRPGDRYTFYEINPLVIEIANHEFSFLRESAAKIDIVRGDARLSLESEPLQEFDVLAVDAFSGDSIPVHLLTREAFTLYLRHLKTDGILAVHISNKHLDLQPVVEAAAAALKQRAFVVSNGPDEKSGVYIATWVLLSGRGDFAVRLERDQTGGLLEPSGRTQLWTDNYSSIFRLLK